MQSALFRGRTVCFLGASIRKAPKAKTGFLGRKFVVVRFSNYRNAPSVLTKVLESNLGRSTTNAAAAFGPVSQFHSAGL